MISNDNAALRTAVAMAGKNDLLKSRNYIGADGVLYLYGIIGDYWDEMDAFSVVRQVEAKSGMDIVVRFQCRGGNLIEGLAMYNALKRSAKNVIGYIDGIAASMGSAVAMGCDTLYIPTNALMMLHKPLLPEVNNVNANDLRDLANGLDSLEEALVQLYVDKTGKTNEEIAALISDGKDHFFRGQDAIDYGLADALTDEIKVAAQAKFDDYGIPLKFARQLFFTAAAAAPPTKEVKPMKFKIRSKGRAALAFALAGALNAEYKTLQAAEAVLADCELSVPLEDLLQGKAEAKSKDLETLAEALDIDVTSVEGVFSPAASPGNNALPGDAIALAAQAAAAEAVKQERKRAADLRAVGAMAQVDEKTVQGWIDQEISIDQARAQALEAVAQRDQQNGPRCGFVRTHNGQPAGLRVAMANAILHRVAPSVYKIDDASAEFRGLSLLESIRAYLEYNGEGVRGKSRDELIAMAMHTTSDFPLLMADVANKELLRTYALAPRTFTAIARETSAKDFKAKHVVELGEGSALTETNEKGEFDHGTISESGESYRVKTFGRIFTLSRKVIINDDLDAFMRFFQLAGGQASRLESDIVWSLVTSNPDLSDGSPVYGTGAARKNQVSGTAVDETTLDGLRKSIRQQKGLDGSPLNIGPKTLCVGSNRETQAQKFLALVQPTQASEVNPFARSMDLVVETRLDVTNNPFYAFVDPALAPTLAYCYLEGNREPWIEMKDGFNVDGVSLKVRHDFGAGWESFRGTAKCTGQ